ncbi:MAG: hypothetical protein JSW46_04595, partial [Gemmatimonadota bacterium]
VGSNPTGASIPAERPAGARTELELALWKRRGERSGSFYPQSASARRNGRETDGEGVVTL